MIFLKRFKWPALFGIMALVSLVACEEDPTTIGAGIIGNEPFNSSKAEFEVFAFNRKVEAVQTNRLPIYQLGVFNDPVYGRSEAQITSQLRLSQTNPSFGAFSQSIENNPDLTNAAQRFEVGENGKGEDEKIKRVTLYIPYLTKALANRDTDNDGVDDVFEVGEETNPNNDSDGDTISNATEKANGTNPLNADTDGDGTPDNEDTETTSNTFAKRFDLDSIYGDRSRAFNLKVERSTFFLRDLDPNSNFLESQEYFSTQQFSPTFVDDVFFDGDVVIDDKETVFFMEDDPDTDVDESFQVESKRMPGISVALDTTFFGENLIRNEGKSQLLSQSNFTEFLRGIHLSLTPTEGEDLMLLLNLGQANITVTYDYNRVDTKATTDTEDDEIVREERDFVLNLLQVQQTGVVGGNAVNTFINDEYPVEVSDQIDTDVNASRIYLKGGAGSYSEIRLFDNDGDGFSEFINDIKAKNWIINEANLVFYVDRTSLDISGMTTSETEQSFREPARLYLYKLDSGNSLINELSERSIDQSLYGSFLNYDGIVQLNAAGKADKYSIKITDHINDLVVRDSLNVKLGLTITSDIGATIRRNAMVNGGEEIALPLISTVSPLGTVIFGSEVDNVNSDRRLKLEIFYTEAN